jgi:PPE-repeat protein
MEFIFFPPEINSWRMYTGPGSGSLLIAAGSWDSLSAELGTTAETYESVVSGLDLQWRGAASAAMAASAARYMGWLQMTAEQTRRTAMQIRSVAAAYEQAHAMTVPPAAVTANRTQLKSLVATNLLGQNTAAIAANEAKYAEYWAQDATAMSSYATTTQAATTQLPQFSSPNKSTSESGLAAQNTSVTGAVNSAAASSSASQAVSAITPAASTVTPALTAQPAAGLTSSSTLPTNPIVPDDFTLLDGIVASFAGINSTYNLEAFVSGVIGAESNLGILPKLASSVEPAPALAAASPLTGAASSLGGGAGLGDVSATLARAGTIGPMSVPASWSAPSTTTVSALTPAGFTTLPGTDEAIASGYPGYPGMPGAMASRGMGVGAPPRYGVRLTVMPRPPAAG